ncbi:hypothetical protein [Streptomyces sp. NPDC058623]|uniref:hypothetical protein n=1 Tax=Streptomyces sp. NPDC058623 TaxID=3346563 RepID=UPI00364748F7
MPQIREAPEFHRDTHLGNDGRHEELGTPFSVSTPPSKPPPLPRTSGPRGRLTGEDTLHINTP